VQFVLDANVAIYAFAPQRVITLLAPTRGAVKPAARNFLRSAARRKAEIVVPPRFKSEVTKGLALAAFSTVIDWTIAEALLQEILNIPVTMIEPDHMRVLELTRILKRKSSYDLEYAALAESLGCACITADRPFVNAMRQMKGKRPEVTYVLKHPWA
jgi:predicted nucleic acid-binding protein